MRCDKTEIVLGGAVSSPLAVRRSLYLIAYLLGLGLTQVQGATFHELSAFPGVPHIQPVVNGISRDGKFILGGIGRGYPPGDVAIRWNSSGIPQILLGNITSGSPTQFRNQAYASSSDGQSVVGSYQASAINDRPRAFQWDSLHGVRPLGALPGAAGSTARDASADGQVVVGESGPFGLNDVTHPFIWTSELGMQPLIPDNLGSGMATAISSDGIAVAGYGYSNPQLQEYYTAFRWTSGEGFTWLGDLPGGPRFSKANDISDDGNTVVGWSRSAKGSEAFVWTSSTGMIGIGDLGSTGVYSMALSTTSDGLTVVGAAANGPNISAFVWDRERGMRDLRQMLMDEYGLHDTLTSWQLYDAYLSADGKALAGNGLSPSGFSSWLVVLPEPSGLRILFLGLSCLCLGCRRSN